jgi:hypothetical protein
MTGKLKFQLFGRGNMAVIISAKQMEVWGEALIYIFWSSSQFPLILNWPNGNVRNDYLYLRWPLQSCEALSLILDQVSPCICLYLCPIVIYEHYRSFLGSWFWRLVSLRTSSDEILSVDGYSLQSTKVVHLMKQNKQVRKSSLL